MKEGDFPKDNSDRLKIAREMHAHSQYCFSGDNTLEGTLRAINRVSAEEDADERYVIILSDANLDRYGIHPSQLGRVLTSNPKVKAFASKSGFVLCSKARSKGASFSLIIPELAANVTTSVRTPRATRFEFI